MTDQELMERFAREMTVRDKRIAQLEHDKLMLRADIEHMKTAWTRVRTLVICTVGPACAEHSFKDVTDAVAEMDRYSETAKRDS